MRTIPSLALLMLFSTAGCRVMPDDPRLRGETLYANCVACHSQDGSGNPPAGAPAIAGLPRWYVQAQLTKFRAGHRGTHPDDINGMKMRPMSLMLREDADLVGVATYVSSLPPVKRPVTLSSGDPVAGQALFAVCTACHGPTGAGNEALKAPPITQQDDWYLLGQLQKFKAGIRGANPNDASGATMRPMAMTLADDQAMRNVIAYARTLAK
ncbi:MAG: c-type cytochrome [Deltaproteobacteria bacterium]|nr:c-type cytochrome [Deltaproteobacteria bacterium]